MKIRILGNSIRLRLGRSEVDAFGHSGSVEESVRFGPMRDTDLCYRLEMVDGEEFRGNFENRRIVVGVPRDLARAWVLGDDVSLSGKKKIDEETYLTFLIEKDFVCLNAHNDEDQSDRYPHPKGPEAC